MSAARRLAPGKEDERLPAGQLTEEATVAPGLQGVHGRVKESL